MTVYVDDMYKHPMGRYGRMNMSHMYADTEEELYAMVDLIGVQRKWVQYPGVGRSRTHFDISQAKRELAIQHGAVPLTMRELARLVGGWRKADR